MKFSLVVPIYNIEKYIKECLDSILSQTYLDFEVILVDDGSTDNCPLLCDEYALKDKRIKVIHKNNGGRVKSRQIGVEAASGDYIVCIDGDDWVSPDYLSQFANIIDKYNPDVVLCNSIYAYPDKNIVSQSILRKGYYCKEDLNKEIYPRLIYPNLKGESFPAQLWAKAFRKSLYIKYQLVNVKVEMGEDRACVIPTLYASMSMYVANFSGYYYRQIPTSITKTKKPLKVDGPKLIFEHLSKHVSLNKFDLANQLYQGTCHSLFNVCKSQFYNTAGYWRTRKIIGDVLNDPVYNECISNAKFKGSVTRKLMHYALKCRLYFLMFVYSKFS